MLPHVLSERPVEPRAHHTDRWKVHVSRPHPVTLTHLTLTYLTPPESLVPNTAPSTWEVLNKCVLN